MSQDAYSRAVSDIPRGETRTFMDLAAMAGQPGAARAAGRAIGALPVGSRIPWHRVVASDGSLAKNPRRAAAHLQRLRREGTRPRAGERLAAWVRRTGAKVLGRRPERIFTGADNPVALGWPAARLEPFASPAAARAAGFVAVEEAAGAVSENGEAPARVPEPPVAPLRRLLAAIDWRRTLDELLGKGCVHLPAVLSEDQCLYLRSLAGRPDMFARSIRMAPKGYGVGEYHYWSEPAPRPIGILRRHLYDRLLPAAEELRREGDSDGRVFPSSLDEFWKRCRAAGQERASSILLTYGEGGVNHPHRDIYGEEWFPLQALVVLSRRGTEFEGGRFVLLEEKTKGKETPHEIEADMGDAVLFCSRWRWREVRGKRRKLDLRHAMTPVTSGRRLAVGIVFNLAE